MDDAAPVTPIDSFDDDDLTIDIESVYRPGVVPETSPLVPVDSAWQDDWDDDGTVTFWALPPEPAEPVIDLRSDVVNGHESPETVLAPFAWTPSPEHALADGARVMNRLATALEGRSYEVFDVDERSLQAQGRPRHLALPLQILLFVLGVVPLLIARNWARRPLDHRFSVRLVHRPGEPFGVITHGSPEAVALVAAVLAEL